MAFELILKMSGDDGAVRQVSLGEICRTEVHDVALLGLGLSESKQVLTRLQREIVTRQFESTARERRPWASSVIVSSSWTYSLLLLRRRRHIRRTT